MKRKISLSTTVTLVLLTMALTISLTMLLAMRHFNNQLQSVGARQQMYNYVHDVDQKVRACYPQLDETELRKGIAQGYIAALNKQDPYAAYYEPARYAAEQLRLSGKATNMGITLTLTADKKVVVSRVQPNSDAAKQGVKQGDVVTAVDDVSVDSQKWAELQTQLNTAKKMTITVQRGEETKSMSLTAPAENESYVVRSVQETVLGTVGYVRIYAFYENTPEQFRAAISALMEQGVTGLIFDLRGNAGGSTAAVQEMLGYVMPVGAYGTITDVNGTETKLSASVNNQLSVSTVTIVNSSTAGEAELFAGVLQDGGFTTVVGQTTAGKAKYQEFFTIEADYSAVKLTVGTYGLMRSGSWEGKGITPTVEAKLPEEQAAISQLLTPEEDAQVKVALEQITDSGLPGTTPSVIDPSVTDPTGTDGSTAAVPSGSTTTTTAGTSTTTKKP
ncbi:MAG: PDZ domain-containing protein [Clostridia bacterium]|nr:PDZ domain-containing protein [Clostridia bacterium]